jgi:hypothetical protein
MVGNVGLDTGKDPKAQDQALLKLENARMERESSIEKRYGSTSLTNGYDGARITTNNGRPLLYGTSCRKHNGATATAGGFSTIGDMALLDIAVEPIKSDFHVSGIGMTLWHTVAEAGNVLALGYLYTQGAPYYLHIKTFHRYSGVLLDETDLTAGSGAGNRMVKIVESNGKLYYFYVASTNRIRGAEIDALTGSIAADYDWAPAPDPWTGLPDASSVYLDAAAYGGPGNDHVVVSYPSVYGGGRNVFGLFNQGSFSYWWHSTSGTPVLEQTIQWDSDLFLALILEDDGSNYVLTAEVVDNGMITIFSFVQVFSLAKASWEITRLSAVMKETDVCEIYWNQRTAAGGAASSEELWSAEITGAAGALSVTTAAARVMRKALMVAKPFGDLDGEHYVPVATDIELAETTSRYLVLQGGSAAPAAKCLEEKCQEQATGLTAGIFGGGTHNYPIVQNSYATATGWRFPAHKILNSLGHMEAVAIDVSEDLEAVTPVEIHQGTILPNGCPMYTDGRDIVEQDFLVPPSIGVAARGVGTALGAGTYQWAVVWEWTDANGNLLQSLPAYKTLTLGAPDTVNVTVYSLCPTLKPGVILATYRTEADGPDFYRLVGKEQKNDATVDSIGYVDDLPDSSINTDPTLYTDDNTLENTQPPSYRVTRLHQSRQVVADRELEAELLYYSKPFLDSVHVEHNDALTISVPAAGGRVTALASLMDRLIIFKNSMIYAVAGNGLSFTGGQTSFYRDYTDPQIISEAIGCTDQATVVAIPTGLMFLSERGLYLLDKTLRVSPIGEPVQYHTDNETITRAVMLPDQQTVVFTTEAGGALVYNFLRDRWCTWTTFDAQDATVDDSGNLVVVNNNAGWSAGTARVQDRTTYRDSASAVALKLESGWISLAKLGGCKRLYRVLVIGQNLTAATLKFLWQFDLDPHWHGEQELDLSTLTAFDVDSYLGDGEAAGYLDQAMILEVSPPAGYQKCTAFRFQIYDASQAGGDNCPSYSITAVAALVGLKTGHARIGEVRRLEAP